MKRTKGEVRAVSHCIINDKWLTGSAAAYNGGQGEANAATWATGHNTANAIDAIPGLDGLKAIGPELVEFVSQWKRCRNPIEQQMTADEFMQAIKKGVDDEVA